MEVQTKNLIDKWINDSNFRSQMRKDPEGALRKTNVKLSVDEWKAFTSIDWSQSDEALKARINKAL